MKLVFIHGAGSSSLAFYYQLQHFRNSKALDLPGHPNGRPCPSIEQYLEWVRGFTTARRYKDMVICGHSMGGAISMLYALRYPEEVRGIILMGTGARLRVHPDYLQLGKESTEDSAQWLENQMAYYPGVASDMVQSLKRRSMEIGPAVEYNDLMACDKFDVMNEVQQIKLPTLVLCGSEDSMTPVKYADYLTDNISGARKVVVPGASHFVQLQKYKQVNASIEEFLTSLKRG
ncbi:MAG: alpha/beta hydrolase [Chloroflexi bacterium]|nr:alpha/beta hydrolase [Chloroflexota bacterium]